MQVFGKSANHFNDVVVEPINSIHDVKREQPPLVQPMDNVSGVMTDKQREAYNQQFYNQSQTEMQVPQQQEDPFRRSESRVQSSYSRKQSEPVRNSGDFG